MQKLTGLLIAGNVTAFLLVILVGTGVWVWFAAQNPPPAEPEPVAAQTAVPGAANSYAEEMATLQQTMQQRSQTYQQQITTLQTSLQDRQTAYQTELTKAETNLNDYNNAVSQQQQSLDALNAQITQLEQALAQRQTGYQAQLARTQADLQARADQLTITLQEGQVALVAANAQLGR